VKLVRRRDGRLVDAAVEQGAPALGFAVLHIAGEPFGPGETEGYQIAEASPAERAQIERAGYTLAEASL
jgi:hypothetical protein